MKLKLLLLLLLAHVGLAQTIELEEFATGLSAATEIANDGTNNFLYVAQQGGAIKILKQDGTINTIPFLNITPLVRASFESGLLGLAFHPDYAANGYFYLYYINTSNNVVVARYTRSTTDPEIADATTGTVIFTATEISFSGNHNGGCLRFGPDGYLYISIGDGENPLASQNINSLRGKILRINIDNTATYTIPEGNPFVGIDGADEIWAYGLRNAWKFSFDENDMWIADVGQDNTEEIDLVSAASSGNNFGWSCYEGNTSYFSGNCPDYNTLTFPVAQYFHDTGCSVTGGYVYRGTMYPNLQGKYVFGDFCYSSIGYIDRNAPETIRWTPYLDHAGHRTFGEDVNGELYVVASYNGIIYKITDTSFVTATTQFANSNVTVYPNPADNEVTVTIKNFDLLGQITVYDLGGKHLMQQQITTGVTRINTSALQAGIYLLEVTSSGNRMQQKLVIK